MTERVGRYLTDDELRKTGYSMCSPEETRRKAALEHEHGPGCDGDGCPCGCDQTNICDRHDVY